MKFKEVSPHLNKISRVYLRNNKRKICWLYIDEMELSDGKLPNKVRCVSVPVGRKLFQIKKVTEYKDVNPHSETILIRNILSIKSS